MRLKSIKLNINIIFHPNSLYLSSSYRGLDSYIRNFDKYERVLNKNSIQCQKRPWTVYIF